MAVTFRVTPSHSVRTLADRRLPRLDILVHLSLHCVMSIHVYVIPQKSSGLFFDNIIFNFSSTDSVLMMLKWVERHVSKRKPRHNSTSTPTSKHLMTLVSIIFLYIPFITIFRLTILTLRHTMQFLIFCHHLLCVDHLMG